MCIYGKGDLTDTFSIYEDGIYKTNPQVLRFEKAELVSFENGEITIKINNMYFVGVGGEEGHPQRSRCPC